MKSLFANYNDIVHLNLNKFENESLSETFYETLPKFKELYKFYYDIFLLDTCKAIYENDSNDYINDQMNNLLNCHYIKLK